MIIKVLSLFMLAATQGISLHPGSRVIFSKDQPIDPVDRQAVIAQISQYPGEFAADEVVDR
jgi:hypothetical protein